MAIYEKNFDALAYDCLEHEVYLLDSDEAANRYDEGYSASLKNTMANILNDRIIDYKSNGMFDEPGMNFCDIGRYDDMPGPEEVKKVVSTIPRECWDEFLKENPEVNTDALKFIDDNCKLGFDIPVLEKHLYVITYSSFDEDGHTVDSIDLIEDETYSPSELAEQCANFLSQTDSARVDSHTNTVYETYDGVEQLFCRYAYMTDDEYCDYKSYMDDYKNVGTEHYNGKLGSFDYDMSQFRIFKGKSEEFLGYIGKETDGSKIQIPEGISNCHRMFWARPLTTMPQFPESAKSSDVPVVDIVGEKNLDRINAKRMRNLSERMASTDTELELDSNHVDNPAKTYGE